jgi:glycosyltransferase involved in cell wall biosynthesis
MTAAAAWDALAGKKVVILIGSFNRGGSERQAYLLVRQLRERFGLNAEVWALCWDAEYRKEFEAAGVPTRVLGFRPPLWPCDCCGIASPRWMRVLRWAGRVWRVSRLLRQARVDILLPYTTWPNVVAGLAYRLAGVRLCIWGERSAGWERIHTPEALAVKQYGHFVANSTAGVEFLVSEMRVAREKISLVPNGIEEPKRRHDIDWRERLGLAPGQLLVTKVANLSKFKDHATLLKAWKIVQDSWGGGDKPVLALAGANADQFNALHSFAREAGLLGSVRFLGSIEDVPGLLAQSDLTAFSSRMEGMPNAVLECMAAGKAIVATDLPGVRDALGPNAPESIVASGDAEAYAHRLLDMLSDTAKRDAQGTANQARIRSEFSVERMAERYVGIIRASLSHKVAGSARQAAMARPSALS